ncbi:porin family protein [Leeuwenhoekiella marinoflava]|uniref:Outer membrane protein with beta-barrel domain n=2 Tax=Leeuwenhoekiella marinoflava TaxID=988 RepID=A0A4Q0PK82_9FLAO|nr:porin family protein [Leeuwenhoekiella marinoflava]RXG28311.1 outer membrane protein with beta-barrel domain [Leeuwenhoekiella marinoflava]SHF56652.1 Outer membrane protein beta-barrel domain-containing protein [Leeuwenhoekiella marinoflava DSM 3653]
MKKAFLGILFLVVSYAHAQSDPGFGIKAGLNYGGTGDISDSASRAYQDPSSDIGYHVGVFGRTGEKLYLRPELVYTKLNSTYEDNDFSMQKLDLPVLVGYEVIGPLSIFAGPAFQYILDTKYDGITLGDVKNDFTVGLNIGAGLALGKLGIDLRYERGFGDNEAEFLDSNGIITDGSRIDTRPDQLILSFSLNL